MAGYVAIANKQLGGTDLKIFVDLDIATYVPAWVLQMLAQYGLPEIMVRIRQATAGSSLTHLVTPASTHSQLDTLLGQIHSREERMRQHFDAREKDGMDFGISISGMGGLGTTAAAAKKAQTKTPLSPSTKERKSDGANTGSDVPDSQEKDESKSNQKRNGDPEDVKCYMQVAEESMTQLQMYMGIIEDSIGLGIQWASKLNKNGIDVCASYVNNSSWGAIKATMIVNADKLSILKFLTDDANMGSYDDVFDSAQVRSIII